MKVKKGEKVILHIDGKDYLVASGKGFLDTNRGRFDLSKLPGMNYGDALEASTGFKAYIFRPTVYDAMMKVKRLTQIIYPKDGAYIILRLGVIPGARVLECGCGSGSFTVLLASQVGDEGKVYAYDEREEFLNLARENVRRFGLEHRVEFKLGKAEDGFDESELDAIFLDLPEPWVALDSAYRSLSGGAVLGTLSPTYNQIEKTATELKRRNFIIVETVEILVRHILAREGKTRPKERMVSHTAFLLFARKVNG